MRQNVSSGVPFEDVYGYSRAVRVAGHVHVSGTTAQLTNLELVDAYQQAKAALAVIEKSLEEAGSSMTAVVRTVTYITDNADVELVSRAHQEVFKDIRPAATLVEVAGLLNPHIKVEIEVYAIESN